MAGIYIHIPFCKKACSYCDFHFSTNQRLKANMVAVICQEVKLRKNFLELLPIETVYFGGGTPSVLSVTDFNQIYNALNTHFDLTQVKETTLECNPEDLSAEYLADLSQFGINRLSLGVQSFNDNHLNMLNRNHDSKAVHQAIRLIKESPITNFTIDLIYGIPGLTTDQWLQNLSYLLKYNIPHFSAYALTVEEKTLLSHQINAGKLKEESDGAYFKQFEMLQDFASANGYNAYEISNYAKPKFEAQHNHNYWHRIPYLGLGPSAHSFKEGIRCWNVSNNHKYIQAIENNESFLEEEQLSTTDTFNEYIMTHLRIKQGIAKTDILSLFGSDYWNHITSSFETGDFEDSWFIDKTDRIALTTEGKFVSDHIARELIMV
ncbi:MAG: radical SAM family heme chaperone HemW [Bacteroidetes bacterium]|nr:radical SAM family heme chaperone HemW [Bacteroidota bacterium]